MSSAMKAPDPICSRCSAASRPTAENDLGAAFQRFLSDTVYDRYSIGSPVIDRETGNVYVLTTAGEFVALPVMANDSGALDDGGLRAAYLSEWPRRFSGDR